MLLKPRLSRCHERAKERFPKALNIGVAGHITAAASGGPRYDPALTSEQRCHQDNGIWLCQNCGKLVDNDEVRYNVTLLRAWKVIAEHRALNSIGQTAQPSLETDAQRKLRAILPWKDKTIKVTLMTPPGNGRVLIGPELGSSFCRVIDCNEFVVTIRNSTDNTGSGPFHYRGSKSATTPHTTG